MEAKPEGKRRARVGKWEAKDRTRGGQGRPRGGQGEDKGRASLVAHAAAQRKTSSRREHGPVAPSTTYATGSFKTNRTQGTWMS